MQWSESSQQVMQTRDPVEHTARSECSSESVIPKVCNSLSTTAQSNESMIPKEPQREIWKKPVPAKRTIIYGQNRNCKVEELKLPEYIKVP